MTAVNVFSQHAAVYFSLQNVELECPSYYGQTVASELFRVPFSGRRLRRLRRINPTTVGRFISCVFIKIKVNPYSVQP